MNEISNTLAIISQVICLLPLIMVVVNFRYIKGYLIPVLIFVLVGVLSELTGRILANAKSHQFIKSYIYTLTEFTLISLFYIQFFRQYINTLVFKLITLAFFVCCIVFSCSYSLLRADHYNMAMESFIFTLYCLFLFYFLIKNLVFDNLVHAPVFWINTGVLFYFTGNLTIFLSNAYVGGLFSSATTGAVHERNIMLWVITHTFFNVAMNVLFSIGLWKARVK